MEHKKLAISVLFILLVVGVAGISTSPPEVSRAYSQEVQEPALALPGWQQVNTNGFDDPQAEEVSALEAFSGDLYAGNSNSIAGARIFRAPDGVAWTPVIEPGFGIAHDIRPTRTPPPHPRHMPLVQR